MNDESRALSDTYEYSVSGYAAPEAPAGAANAPPAIPDYLQDTYWWAYLHPKSFYFFEREWVVNLILWGNMKKLTQSVLGEMQLDHDSRALQVACVYGDFSNRLASHLDTTQSRLELVDVAPIQLGNARKKLSGHENVGFHHQDSTSLHFPDDSFDQSVIFFLLHEQPEDARRKTISEALRVTKPGGKIIFVDYHGPKRSNPMRYVMKPILSWLEPFAMDLWRAELPEFMPEDVRPEQLDSKFYFGGLYQKIVLSV